MQRDERGRISLHSQRGRCEVLNNSLISNYQTKLLIMDAADKLVEETPFDKLSVTQICEEAGISRATFYRCFKDKFAIAQWHVELAWAQGANEIGRTLSWKEGYYITEANIASRNLFYAGVAKSNDYNAIDNFAPRLRRKTITETLTQMRKVPLTEHLKFQIDATVGSRSTSSRNGITASTTCPSMRCANGLPTRFRASCSTF